MIETEREGSRIWTVSEIQIGEINVMGEENGIWIHCIWV